MLTIDEFERAWDYMITLYNLSGNDYLENIYKMPFGLFVGVNNRFQTTTFGGVFMKEETTRSFECFSFLF